MNSETINEQTAVRGTMPRVRPERRVVRGGFRLLRWYSATSLIAMAVVAVGFAMLGSRFMAVETLQRDAVLTAQFIDSMIETESQHWGFAPQASLSELLDPRVDPMSRGFTSAQVKAARAEFYDHVRLLPDELLANVYAPDMTIIWSSNPKLVGRRDQNNLELREVFDSRHMVARGHLQPNDERREQVFVNAPEKMFIENYIPLPGVGGEVAAVVEIYKEPKDLLAIIERGQKLIWAASLFAGIVVYLVTFSIVRRGHHLLMDQQQRLLDNETLVAVGELSTAIAHSLRNPLASIRTSAELAQEEDDPRVRKLSGDIVRQVDRMSRWIKDLLLYTRPQAAREEAVALQPLVADVVAEFQAQCSGRSIEISSRLPDQLPAVHGNRTMIAQALQSVIANAVEAIPGSGRVEVSAVVAARTVTLKISDSGRGMSQAQLETAFRPFATTKAKGLGVGLALVRQITERFGGSVELASREGVGTDVYMSFRTAGTA